MNTKVTLLLAIALGIGVGALAFRSKQVERIPEIHTQYDTVTVIDTLWLKKLSHDTLYKHDTVIVERQIAQKPETTTIFVSESGITAVQVGQKRGDTTNVLFFKTELKDSTSRQFIHHKYLWQTFTPGPLKSVLMLGDGKVATDFYSPPKACTPWKDRALGAGAVTLLRLVLGK